MGQVRASELVKPGAILVSLGMRDARDTSYVGSLFRIDAIDGVFVIATELATRYHDSGILGPTSKPVVFDVRRGWDWQEPSAEHLAARGLSHLLMVQTK